MSKELEELYKLYWLFSLHTDFHPEREIKVFKITDLYSTPCVLM
jgi:hypothetical protein